MLGVLEVMKDVVLLGEGELRFIIFCGCLVFGRKGNFVCGLRRLWKFLCIFFRKIEFEELLWKF